MKNIIFGIIVSVILTSALSCKKEYVNYPDGYDHMYYVFFDYNYDNPDKYNANLTVNIKKNYSELTPIKVKFMSSFIRDYDVAVKMYVQQPDSFYVGVKATTINLAKPNVDYQLLDSNQTVMNPIEENGEVYYLASFPNARKDVQTFYLKMLNNTADNLNKTFFFSFTPTIIYTGGTEDEFIQSATNNETSLYSVLSYSSSYFRRFNINK